LVGLQEKGKETTKKTKCRLVDNIKIDLVEISWSGVDWICLAEEKYTWRALVNAVVNLRVT
jgi:hypothetical protein